MLNKIIPVTLCAAFAIACLTARTLAEEGAARYRIEKTQTLRLHSDAVTLQVKEPLPRKDFEDQTLSDLSCFPNYNAVIKDPDGNSIAIFYFSNLAPRSTISIVMSYSVELKNKPFPLEPPQTNRYSEDEYSSKQVYLGDQGDIRITEEIRDASRSITEGKSTPYLKAKAIYDYMVENISYNKNGGLSGVQTSQELLRSKEGVCADITKLFVALARAAGVPARPIAGYVFQPNISPQKSSSKEGHAWAEIYLPEYGWQSVDPTFGITVLGKINFFCFDNKTHIKEIYGQLYSRMAGTLYSGNRIEVRSKSNSGKFPVEAEEVFQIERLLPPKK